MTQVPPPQGYNVGYQPGMLSPHRGGAVLALGILGIVVCVICGIVAWVMGNEDLKQIDGGRMDPSGRGLVQAGRILGIVSVALNCIWIVCALLWVLFVFVLAAGAATSGGGRP